MFIVFEGIDGSGKDTIINKISHWLAEQNVAHITTFEPGNVLGGNVRNIIKEHKKLDVEAETLLFLADRKEHIEHVVKPALKLGLWVLQNRYMLSTVAYQGAKGMSVDTIYELFDKFILLKPNICFLLDVPAEVAYQRIRRRGSKIDKFENITYLTIVRKLYLKYAQDWNCKIVDATQRPDDVYKEIRGVLFPLLDDMN